MEMSSTYRVRLMAPMALFAGEKKDEPVSYPAPTPAAARAMIEAILWKPAIFWHIQKIHILSPIRWFTMRVNEVQSRMLDVGRPIVVEKDRTQRRLTGLRDVDYVVEAAYSFTEKRGIDDTPQKFDEMFRRRLELGQCRFQPYFGRRDFPGYFEPAPEEFHPAEGLLGRTIDVGRMLLDRRYKPGEGKGDWSKIEHEFFSAEIKSGVLVEKGSDSLPCFKKETVGV